MYDKFESPVRPPNEKKTWLEVIKKREDYVIDNSSKGKKKCLLPENRNKDFIISPPLSRENPNTKDLILDKARCKLGNIFSVGILPTKDGPRVLVDRMDEHFQYAFDNPKLTEASRGKGPVVAKQKADICPMIEREKTVI